MTQNEKTPWWVHFFLIVVFASVIVFPGILPFDIWEYGLYVLFAGTLSYFLSSSAYRSQGAVEGSVSVVFSTFLGAFSPVMLLLNIGVFIEYLIINKRKI